jgi:hypothetical protein
LSFRVRDRQKGGLKGPWRDADLREALRDLLEETGFKMALRAFREPGAS